MENYQSGGIATSNVNKNLIPASSQIGSFNDYVSEQENALNGVTPEEDNKTFGSKYISELYNSLDFGDLPIKNETDFLHALLFEDGFADSVHKMKGSEGSLVDFVDTIDKEVYSKNRIYIDPSIDDASRDALGRAYTSPSMKFEDGSMSLFGTDDWVQEALNAGDSGIYRNPNDPTEYVMVKDGTYKKVRDKRDQSVFSKILTNSVKVVSKALGSTVDSIPEILGDILTENTMGEDNIENYASEFMQSNSPEALSYKNREISPEEFQNMSFLEQQAYGWSQMLDPETIINWDWLESPEGLQTISSSLELILPGMMGAKLASKVGLVSKLGQAGRAADDVIKAAVANGKRFSYGEQMGAGLGKIIGYTIPSTVLESRMEAVGTYETLMDLYSTEQLPDGSDNPDYIADEQERKVVANAATNEHFYMGIPNLLATNSLEAAAMFLPYNRLKAFGAIGKVAGVGTGFALGAPAEGIEEISQWGVQEYINQKYSVGGESLKDDSFMDSLTSSWSKAFKGFTENPEANTSFWTGIFMGGLQSGAASVAAKTQEQIYNIKNSDKIALVNASKSSGYDIYDTDEQGNKTINYEKLDGVAKHNADLAANLHLSSNIDFTNETTSTDKLTVLLGERYSSLIQNILQNDTEGLLRNLTKDDFTNFMKNELYKGFRLSPDEYQKKNFQGIRYYDWNKINDNAVDRVLDKAYKFYYNPDANKDKPERKGLEVADTFRIIQANTGNPELDKVINSKSAGLSIGGDMTYDMLSKHLVLAESVPEGADKSDYITHDGHTYRLLKPENKEHVKNLLDVADRYKELFKDLESYSGLNLTPENKAKQDDLLKRFEDVKKYYADKQLLSKNKLGERVNAAKEKASELFKSRKKLSLDKISGVFGKKKSQEFDQEQATKQSEAEAAQKKVEPAVAETKPVTPPTTATAATVAPVTSPIGKTDPEDGDKKSEDTNTIIVDGKEIVKKADESWGQKHDDSSPEDQILISKYFDSISAGVPTEDFDPTMEDNDEIPSGILNEFPEGSEGDGIPTEALGETFNEPTEKDFQGDTGIPFDPENPVASGGGSPPVNNNSNNPIPEDIDTSVDKSVEKILKEANSVNITINDTLQTFVRTDRDKFSIIPAQNEKEKILAERSSEDIGNAIAYVFNNTLIEGDNSDTFLPLLKGEIGKGTKLSFNRASNDAPFRDNQDAANKYNATKGEIFDKLFGTNNSISLKIYDPVYPTNESLSYTVSINRADFDMVQINVDGAPNATTMLHEPLWFLKRVENGYWDKHRVYHPTKAIGISIENHIRYRREVVNAIDTSPTKTTSGVISSKSFSNFDYVNQLDKETGEFRPVSLVRNINTSNNNSKVILDRRADQAFLYDNKVNDPTSSIATKNRSFIPIVHGRKVKNTDIVEIKIRNGNQVEKIAVSVNKSLVNEKNQDTIFTVLDDGNGGFRVYPTNKAQVNNEIKRTISELIYTFIKPDDISPLVKELNNQLPNDLKFIRSQDDQDVVNTKQLKKYIQQFIEIHDDVRTVPKNDNATFNRLPISLNAGSKLGNLLYIGKKQILPKDIKSYTDISDKIDEMFGKESDKKNRYVLPFTAALPDVKNDYKFYVPIISGTNVKQAVYEDLIREHYYSGIEIIDTGVSSKSKIGFVAERQFILNSSLKELPKEETITNIDESTNKASSPTAEVQPVVIQSSTPAPAQQPIKTVEDKRTDKEKQIDAEILNSVQFTGDYYLYVESWEGYDNTVRDYRIQDRNNKNIWSLYENSRYSMKNRIHEDIVEGRSKVQLTKAQTEELYENASKNTQIIREIKARYNSTSSPVPNFTLDYSKLKVGDVINVASKEFSDVTGTLVVSEIESPGFVRFNLNFSNGLTEENFGFHQEEFDDFFVITDSAFQEIQAENKLPNIAPDDSSLSELLGPVVPKVSNEQRIQDLKNNGNINIYEVDGEFDIEDSEDGIIAERIPTIEEAIQIGEKWVAKKTSAPKSVQKKINDDNNDDSLLFQDTSQLLNNEDIIPISNLNFLDDIQSSLLGEIASELLTKTLGENQNESIDTIVKNISSKKFKALSALEKEAKQNGVDYLHPDKKDIKIEDVNILLWGKNQYNKSYLDIFRNRIKLAVNDLLDVDQQKEASMIDLDDEIQENQNRDQKQEDANRLFNPTKKISKKEKLLYNSTVKKADPTGTGLFTTYYSYKEIKPQVISLLSIGNDNYYNPNTDDALELLRKYGEQNSLKDSENNVIEKHWATKIYEKLTDKATYDSEALDTMRQNILVFNRMLEANYMQLYEENDQWRLHSITADFNEREIKDEILQAAKNQNKMVPEILRSKGILSIKQVLDSINFDTTSLDTNELQTATNASYFRKAIIDEILKADRTEEKEDDLDRVNNSISDDKKAKDYSGNITAVARYISKIRKTPLLSHVDSGKSVGLFITPSQLGEDLSRFKNSTPAQKEEFQHVSAKDTLAFFNPKETLRFGIAALAFRANRDEKLSEITQTEYVQSAFHMFFSDRGSKPYYITATPSDGGTNYLVEFSKINFESIGINSDTPWESEYLYNNLIKPDLDRMSAPFIHNEIDFIDLANYAPMRFFSAEELFTDHEVLFSDGRSAEEHYDELLEAIREAPKDKRAAEAKEANSFFLTEMNLYKEKQENKVALTNALKNIIFERSTDLNNRLIKDGFIITKEAFTKLTETQQKNYTYGIHKSLMSPEAINQIRQQMEYPISVDGMTMKRVIISSIVANYMVFHNNMQYIFQGDPSQYTKGYNPNNVQGSYDGFLGNLFKRLKSNISPRDIGNDVIKSMSPKGLEALRKGKFDSANPEHTYQKTTVGHVFVKDKKIPGLNLWGIADVMGSDMKYERFAFDSTLLSKEQYEALDTKGKLDKIIKHIKDPASFFPEIKDYFKVPIADAQEFWDYKYGLDFLEEQGEITNKKKFEIIQRVESNTLTKDDYKYLGVQKPLHVGVREITDTGGNTWKVRDYIKSSAKFLYPQLVKDTEWEAIYANMQKNRVDAVTFNSAIKVGEPKNSIDIFDLDGNYTGADLSDVIQLDAKYKGKQLNIPVDIHLTNSHAAQLDKKAGSGLEHFQLKDGTPMVTLLAEQERIKSDIRRIEKEKLRLRLSNTDGSLNMKELHKLIQEELNSRGFENNAKDIIKLKEELDVDGNIINVLMYPLHSISQPKRFDPLIASIVAKGGVSRGKSPGFGLPQVASVGFKKKLDKKELKDITNESIVPVGKWDLSKGLAHYSNGTEHNQKGLAEVIIPWIFPYPIDEFMLNGVIDESKLPEDFLEGLSYRIPNQDYSSDMVYKVVGFSTDPNSLFVPHEIAIQMGADYDIDKLYGMLPDLEPVYTDQFLTSSDIKRKVSYLKTQLDNALQAQLFIGTYKETFERLSKKLENMQQLTVGELGEYRDYLSANKESIKSKTLIASIEDLENALTKGVPSKFIKAKSKIGKANNELHDIRLKIFSDPNVKRMSLQALDTGINAWYDWYQTKLKALIDTVKPKQDYTNFMYQGYKSDNARVGKDGISIFALNGSTIGLFTGRGVTIADRVLPDGSTVIQYTPIAIEYLDDNNKTVRAVSTESLSAKYDLVSDQKLMEIFKNGFEGKQIVAYENENGEIQYELLDLYAEADTMKSYMENMIADNLTDESIYGMDIKLASQEVIDELVAENLKKQKRDNTQYSLTENTDETETVVPEPIIYKSEDEIYAENPGLKKLMEDLSDESDNINMFKVKELLNKRVQGRTAKLNKILYNSISRLWNNYINANDNLKTLFIEEFTDNSVTALGRYTRSEKKIEISKKQFLNIANKYFPGNEVFYLGYVLNHEIIHYLTADGLDPMFSKDYSNMGTNVPIETEYQTDFGKNITELYDYAKNNLADISDYGFTNLDEFVAEAMTNVQFQEKLASIPYKGSGKSVWKKFMELVSAYLTRYTGNKIDDTLLEAVLVEVTNYINKNSNIQYKFRKKFDQKAESIIYDFDFNIVQNAISLSKYISSNNDTQYSSDLEPVSSTEYKGIPIIDTTDIVTQEGTPGAAQLDRENNVIKINRQFLKKKYDEKAWTNPRKLIETIHGKSKGGVEVVYNNPTDFTNHSGGAVGYDTEWDLIGNEFGVTNHNHYLLPSDGAVSDPRLKAKGVTPIDATNDVGDVAASGPATGEGQTKITTAERQMGRIDPTHVTRNTKKIRNWAQVKNSDGVFAIGSLIPKGAEITISKGSAVKTALIPQVNGGTSGAVQMSINENKPTYVFNQKPNAAYPVGWYTWSTEANDFVPTDTPKLTKNFAGVGTSSDTTEIGKQAIRDVYANTFQSKTPQLEIVESYSDPLPEDQFATYEQFEEFVIEHEYQHTQLSRDQFNESVQKSDKVELYPGTYANADQAEALKIFDTFMKDPKEKGFLLKGRGGTGKSTIAGKMMEIALKEGYQVYATAVSDAATANLNNLSNRYKSLDGRIMINNYASMFGLVPRFNDLGQIEQYDYPAPGQNTAGPKIVNNSKAILVFDEASMVSKDILSKIQKIAPDVKILYMGDNAQIEPIGDDRISSIFTTTKMGKELLQVMRQAAESPILFAANNIAKELDAFDRDPGSNVSEKKNFLFENYNAEKDSGILLTNNLDTFLDQAVNDFKNYGSKETIVITGNNDNISAINTKIRSKLYDSNNLFVAGERVLTYSKYTKYNGPTVPKTEIYNSTVADITSVQPDIFQGVPVYSAVIEYTGSNGIRQGAQAKLLHKKDQKNIDQFYLQKNALQAEWKKGNFKDRNLGKLIDSYNQVILVDYAYAMTAHKIQGQTVRNSYVYPVYRGFDLVESQRMFYTSITRPTDKLVIMSDAPNAAQNLQAFEEYKLTASAPVANTVDPAAVSITKGQYETEINNRALKAVAERNKNKKQAVGNLIAGFYDGEKIVLNKDHRKFGIGGMIHEHMHPLLDDLDVLISEDYFNDELVTLEDKATATQVKNNLYREAVDVLKKNNINVFDVLANPLYASLNGAKRENEIIARAVELTANKVSQNKSFASAMKDFIMFLFKNIKSKFYKAAITNKSITAKDLEPIIGINELAYTYMFTGAAKQTLNSEGNLRQGQAKSTAFDQLMDRLSKPGVVKDIIDNNTFETFTQRYNHDIFNQVKTHAKPDLITARHNNTVYENITVDGANKVAELEASGITPDTMNIAAALLQHRFDPKAITIALSNPLLKDYYSRLKAKSLIDGWSITNQQKVLEEMKKNYLPDDPIDTSLSNDKFYSEKNIGGKRMIIPRVTISEKMMFDSKYAAHNADPIEVERQAKEVIKHQFEALLGILMLQETSRDFISVANLFNINSNGGTKSFIHDEQLADQAREVLNTNMLGRYDVGSVLDESYMRQVLENFVEMREFLSEPGISAIVDYKDVITHLTNIYDQYYVVGEFTAHKKKQFINTLTLVLPEYIKNQVFSSLPGKDNVEYTKFKLLSNNIDKDTVNPDNLANIIDRIHHDMMVNPDHILHIEKTFFNSLEVKKEKNYSLVQFSSGKIAPNIKDNIKTHLIEFYNNPQPLFADRPDYTTKTLIDDLFDYSIVTGGNSGPFKFYDYIPAELILKNLATAERDQIKLFKDNLKTSEDVQGLLLSILMNNPQLLPGLSKLPADYKGRIMKDSRDKLFTVKYRMTKDKAGNDVLEPGKVNELPIITNKTKIKQYTIQFDVAADGRYTVKKGYNVITGSNPSESTPVNPPVYKQDNDKTIGIFSKDKTSEKITAKHLFGDTIIDSELKAIYKELVEDLDVQSADLEFVDIIDNNPANYGRYNRKAHKIQISEKALASGQYSLAEILVHEYTHILMSDTVDLYENIKLGRANKNLFSEDVYNKMKFLDSVFETYRQQHPDAIASINLDEFISEVRRSKDVRNNIKELPKSLLRRVINAITDILKNILGLTNKNNISGQQILDTTIDYISSLSKNKIELYTDGTDMYQFITTDGNTVLHGTKNNSTLVDPQSAYTSVTNDNNFEFYNLKEDQADVLYDPDIERRKPRSYNLSTPEFDKKVKNIKIMMSDPDFDHDDMIKIIERRFTELTYFSQIYKNTLKKSSDKKELSNAKKALAVVEKDMDKIFSHLEKAVKAKTIKDKIDYIDDVIQAISDVVESDTNNPIEVMTANDFLTRLTDLFDPKKIDLNIYTSNDLPDILFIAEEAKTDPELNYKYNQQSAKIVYLNNKLINKTLSVIENELRSRDEFVRTNFNSDATKKDIGLATKWFMTLDRTGDDYMSYWKVLSNDIETAYKHDIAIKMDEFKNIKDKVIPILNNYYANLPNGPQLDHYRKYGLFSVMIDEFGNLKMPFKPEYFTTINKFKSEVRRAEEAFQTADAADRKAKLNELKLKRKAYAEFMSNSNFSKRKQIETAIASETNPGKLRELQRVLDKYDQNKKIHMEKFEADYEVYSEELQEETVTVTDENGVNTNVVKSILEQQTEFIEQNYPYEDLADLKQYVKDKTKKSFEYDFDAGMISRWDTEMKILYKKVPKLYSYVYSVPKTDFWNDMSFLEVPEVAEFYNAYLETFKEIRDNLPARYADEMKLSDIPYIARSVLNYSLKDLIMNKETRGNLFADHISGLTVKDNFLLKDDDNQDYNDNIVNTRFGKLHAFNKHKTVTERLIKRLVEEGLPITDELGRVNPKKANKIKGVYSTKFLSIEQEVKNQVDIELAEMKSFDLGLIAEFYYAEAMAYKHKMKDINNLNLIKDAALKSYSSQTDSKGRPSPLTDKINMVSDADKMMKGIPARKVLKTKFFSALGKQYSTLEKKRKKDLEETIGILDNELTTYTGKSLNQDELDRKTNLEAEITRRKDEIDQLGAEINLGNILRRGLGIDIAVQLWGNARSAIGNTIQAIIANRMEAADGRIFGTDSYKKMFKKIYINSEISPFMAGTFGGILAAIPGGLFSAGLGFAVGYGINRLMHKRVKDPETTVVFNMQGMYDMLQEQSREQQLENVNDRSSHTWRAKLMRSDASELLRSPMMFITKSEIPGQAVILGSILDSTKILDPDNKESEITLLSYLTRIGSSGMMFNADYDSNMYLRLNTKAGPTVTEVPLGFLLQRVASTAMQLSRKTHGNYDVSTKQLAKLNDVTVLATEFKTWAFEGFASRYEAEKVNRTIHTSLTSSPYQTVDEDYFTKGMYQTSFEKLGTPVTLGLALFNPTLSNILWGSVGAGTVASVFGSLGAIVPPIAAALGGAYLISNLNKKGHEKTVDKIAQRAFAKNITRRLIGKLMSAGMYKKFSEVEVNGEMISTEDYLNSTLSKVDAANIRKLIEQTGMLAFFSAMYYTLVAIKLAGGDDDEKGLETKYMNFVLNTMGRTVLDIESYTSAPDIINKYGSWDKIAPATKLPYKSIDAFFSLISGEQYERKTGQYEKGDLKGIKKAKEIIPFMRTYESFMNSTEQEFQLFKGNN